MNRTISVLCPYCGRRMSTPIKNDFGERQLILCDCNEGGCDKYFVANLQVRIVAETLRIEGEAELNETDPH